MLWPFMFFFFYILSNNLIVKLSMDLSSRVIASSPGALTASTNQKEGSLPKFSVRYNEMLSLM